jgi:hypothetical protein
VPFVVKAQVDILLQKLPARKFTVTTLVDGSNLMEGDRSGLLIMGREYSYLAMVRTAGGLQLVRPKNTIHELKTKSVFLRVSMNDGTANSVTARTERN